MVTALMTARYLGENKTRKNRAFLLCVGSLPITQDLYNNIDAPRTWDWPTYLELLSYDTLYPGAAVRVVSV